MVNMEFISFDELEDKIIGKVGTARRDAYEAKVKEEVKAYYIGETMKKRADLKNCHKDNWKS